MAQTPSDADFLSPRVVEGPKAITPGAADAEQPGVTASAQYLFKDAISNRDTTAKQISQFWNVLHQITPTYFDANIEHIVKIGQENDPANIDEETAQVCQYLTQALHLRQKYLYHVPCPDIPKKVQEPAVFDQFSVDVPCASDHVFKLVNGIYTVYTNAEEAAAEHPQFDVASVYDYFTDLAIINKIIAFGPAKSFTYNRLKLLDAKFNMYQLLNEEKEFMEQKSVPGRDFYNVRKVDTHIHHSSSMNQKHLLKFIKRKLREAPDDVVIYRDGHLLTLREVFESINMSPHDLSVDTLDVHADKKIFHRFDRFNLKYNPFGISRLREIFLKTDNHIKGRYLAELTHELFRELEASKYQHAEYRISIYGRSVDEWDKLASWVVDHKLFNKHVRWMIQIPRLYGVHKGTNSVKSFEQMLTNIFRPLFEVTQNPASHPKLHILLQQVIGFDCVDDESKPERRVAPSHIPSPAEWDSRHDPPYAYYMYYLYANLKWLCLFREAKGFTTFTFRPHAGEAGDVEHLASTFLVAHGINHGIQLRHSPVLQYLHYLTQIGIAMSPLSNNSLFLDYQNSPFPKFFERGLNVSLSTDDPMQFHFTREPLIEEYSIAAQMWKLNTCDLCEIARNSCLQSGFEPLTKAYWLGENYMSEGPSGNDIYKTNVPNIRLAFRHELLIGEKSLIRAVCELTFVSHLFLWFSFVGLGQSKSCSYTRGCCVTAPCCHHPCYAFVKPSSVPIVPRSVTADASGGDDRCHCVCCCCRANPWPSIGSGAAAATIASSS
eukprot:TRINITY_DN3486_c0_g1_i1.p1 TRINITY_DN3486_c0_g1~~TRINITY_DN3486_c0_g1_i1.p1  ORF type:complete len:784 (+),score=142.57 TRINITY_DN3486_c0_g1_i1:28-2352(+)